MLPERTKSRSFVVYVSTSWSRCVNLHEPKPRQQHQNFFQETLPSCLPRKFVSIGVARTEMIERPGRRLLPSFAGRQSIRRSLSMLRNEAINASWNKHEWLQCFSCSDAVCPPREPRSKGLADHLVLVSSYSFKICAAPASRKRFASYAQALGSRKQHATEYGKWNLFFQIYS